MGSLHIGVIVFRMDTVNPIVQIGATPTRVGAIGVTTKDEGLQVRAVNAFHGTKQGGLIVLGPLGLFRAAPFILAVSSRPSQLLTRATAHWLAEGTKQAG